MNFRLTLQHGIGLQQLFLDLIHLLALPTHCRHIWHHQLTGLWSRVRRMSVGSLPNWQRNKCSLPVPLSTDIPLTAFLQSCVWRSLFSPIVTIIASYYHHRNYFGGQMYPRHDSDDVRSQSCYVSTSWLLCWGTFFKIMLWIINRIKSDPPCRMTPGIGIISTLQQDESDPEPRKDRKEVGTSCWMTVDQLDIQIQLCSAKRQEGAQNTHAKTRSHYFADYFLSPRVAEHTSYVNYQLFKIMLCLLCAVVQPWSRHECQWPISLACLWWPCSFGKLWEPDQISKNPNLSLHLDRAASWGGALISMMGWMPTKKKPQKTGWHIKKYIIYLLLPSIIPLPKGLFKVENYSG